MITSVLIMDPIPIPYPIQSSVFFGEHWDAPILDHAWWVPTPVGVVCYPCDCPIHRGDQGFIRPLITENGPGGDLPVHRGCDMATAIGHLFGICSHTGWDDIYERGQELVRRDNEGLLKPIGSETIAGARRSPFNVRRFPNRLGSAVSARRFPVGPWVAGTVAQQAR
jgi:hypothetical protein